MSILRFLMLPFAMVYDLIMNIRNRMYDLNIKPSASFDVPVIGIGNLAVGGTGKTPMVEHIIRQKADSHKIVTLSRGYGRKTKGFHIARVGDTAKTIGDEPLQLFSKYGNRVSVAVCEDRAFAIPHIMDQLPDSQIVIMDDAFQHRRVKPGLQILLTEYKKPFYEDHVLPFGRLREGPEGAERADIIVVTKCPDHLEEDELMFIEHAIKEYSKATVFFSKIRYGEPRAIGDHKNELTSNVVLVSGIANHHVLEEYVSKNYKLIKHFSFRDHHNYSEQDLRRIDQFVKTHQTSGEKISILTTEKDRAKLETDAFQQYWTNLPIFYLPIEMEFLRNGTDFDALIDTFLNSFSSE